LWASTAQQLLHRTSSADPTPGGGAIAAVTAALGLGLVQMAIAISAGDGAADDVARFGAAQSRARELQAAVVEAADRDVAEFDALMAAYRMPRGSEDERTARARLIDETTVIATQGPLSLAEAAIAGTTLADQVEPLVKSTIVSDVQAGRDLLCGAVLAALRTADINLAGLEQRGHPEALDLRRRRDAVRLAVTSVQERECRHG
jgi:formiminotetrahydrofolate cyclodeaminase